MLTGDIAAALIGRKFGRHKLVNGKSLEGTVSFIIVGYIALAVVLVITHRPLLPDFAIGFLAVLVGGLVELFQKQLRLDDNLSIPLSVGLVLLLTLL